MLRITATLCVIAYVLSTPVTVLAASGSLMNDSAHCAWITIYHQPMAPLSTKWDIAGGNMRPSSLKAGKKGYWGTAGKTKIRAEVFPSAQCSGGKVADVDFVASGNGVNLYLSGTGRNFRIRE